MITDASSGIGEALTTELARQGAVLVLTARRAERLERFKAGAPDPGKVHLLPGDLTDGDGIAALAAQAEQQTGAYRVR